ncbi:hypothetical protein EFL26_07405 [Nocardioides pocheonensis]|uniref:DUF2567 domain-containing protein n=1 Tax=Nocardioides pocheonensis TaxID=661485 RepID=A0A3N0GU27_9ACTN|nr:hypothetical protein EFL26_07405 [Nocardioides pocheonensis]
MPPTAAPRRLLSHPVARDLAVVLVWFVALGVLAAVVWWQVTPLADYTRTATNAEMGEEQLGQQVAADGWYLTLGAVGGLLSGVALLSMRWRDPLLMVAAVTVGSLLGAWVMLRVGLWLGPADPKSVLPHAAVGARVPMQLKPGASGVVYVWPITALLGAIGVIWGTEQHRTGSSEPAAVDGTGSGADAADEPSGHVAQ